MDFLRTHNTGVGKHGKTFGEIGEHFVLGGDEACIRITSASSSASSAPWCISTAFVTTCEGATPQQSCMAQPRQALRTQRSALQLSKGLSSNLLLLISI